MHHLKCINRIKVRTAAAATEAAAAAALALADVQESIVFFF